jgi:hypothetical protein
MKQPVHVLTALCLVQALRRRPALPELIDLVAADGSAVGRPELDVGQSRDQVLLTVARQ